MLAVPFSLIGAIGILALLGYNLSVAVWVGIIALAGLDAETGVVMLLYLDLAYEDWKKRGLMGDLGHLRDAIYHGAVKRVRPKAMTACVIVAGLAPILWSHGTGADVMKAHRHAHGRRCRHLHDDGVAGLSGDLLHLALARDPAPSSVLGRRSLAGSVRRRDNSTRALRSVVPRSPGAADDICATICIPTTFT